MQMKRFKKHSKTILIVVVFTALISFSFQSKFFEVAKQIEIYNTLFKELNLYYMDEINPSELTNKAIKNTLKDLDPYTNYYTEQDVEDAKIRREGEYGGLGMNVFYTPKGILIREIYEGFPADKAGLKAGDIITKVDNQLLKNLDEDEQSLFLKGIPNTSISIQIERQGKIFTKTVPREKVVVDAVPFFEMVNPTIGYITLTSFSEKASTEVKKAFYELKQKGMNKLIFDLRSNPGGSLLEAINISNFFLEKDKIIVSTKGKFKQWSNVYKSTNNPLDLEIPIVVLIDGGSASASEIVSGALQDYDRAVIVGERSFGKGLVQRYRELSYGTQLKVTISKYYTPSGRCIQELDYSKRDDEGNPLKFSDTKINEFTTQNGRKVYDGGGIQPDVETGLSSKNEVLKALLNSKSLFNFATNYYYKNQQNFNSLTFIVNDQLFTDFVNTAVLDTTFVLPQEKLFKKAFDKSINIDVSNSKQEVYKKLSQFKQTELIKNKTYLKPLLANEIVLKFGYEKDVFTYKLANDLEIKKAVDLLENPTKYKQLLSVK